MFTIEYSETVLEHLKELRTFDRSQILDQIDSKLVHQPTEETRNKKLDGLVPP
jgi:mRNA-degrading endonuclease RelE of RelBE toxin-antitoxin system